MAHSGTELNYFQHCIPFENFRQVEIDYDTDDSGVFKAKRGNNDVTQGAKEILDSTVTKIDTPLELMKTQTIAEDLSSTLRF